MLWFELSIKEPRIYSTRLSARHSLLMQVLFSEAAAREKLSNISEIISEELEESLETANLS